MAINGFKGVINSIYQQHVGMDNRHFISSGDRGVFLIRFFKYHIFIHHDIKRITGSNFQGRLYR